MTNGQSYQVTQGFKVLKPKEASAYPIPCDEWNFLKSKLERLTHSPWFFHTMGAVFLGVGLSTCTSIILGGFPRDDNLQASAVAWAVVAVAMLVGGACLLFASQQRKLREDSASEVVRQMELIELRYPARD